MRKWKFFVGIDVASASFTAAVGTHPWQIVLPPQEFSNNLEGFRSLLDWLNEQRIPFKRSVVCLEATGVYGEALAHFLLAHKLAVAIEPPLKVKRAFQTNGPKTDAADSRQIAEYAYRFADELRLWQPRGEVLEQIQALLATREQLVRQRTSNKNILTTLERKVVRTPAAERAHQQTVAFLNKEIKAVEKELARLIDDDPDLRQRLRLLLSIPGVGMLLAAHLLLLTQRSSDPRQLAAHLGIAPHEHRSGTSLHGLTQSRHFGPPAPRKLLYLAACSVRTHNQRFRDYFLHKRAEGKAPRLVLNNIQNRLLKIACAVLRDQQPFIPNYHSLPPLTQSSYS
ncbi:MAG: IS110 family transposase, partial [Anaerolineales bacterium]|nr:IS110 family transposase [Anaerolineales bacterium]